MRRESLFAPVTSVRKSNAMSIVTVPCFIPALEALASEHLSNPVLRSTLPTWAPLSKHGSCGLVAAQRATRNRPPPLTRAVSGQDLPGKVDGRCESHLRRGFASPDPSLAESVERATVLALNSFGGLVEPEAI